MEVMEAIRTRSSYRGAFEETPVSREDMREILEAGVLAPSGCNLQTTRLVGVDDPAVARRLAEAYGKEWALTAPAAVVLLTREHPETPGGSRHIEDFAAAAENILLAITAKGYAGVWIEGQIAGEPAKKMSEILHVPEDLHPAVYIPFGVPVNPLKKVPKKAFEDRAWFNSCP